MILALALGALFYVTFMSYLRRALMAEAKGNIKAEPALPQAKAKSKQQSAGRH